MPVDRCMCQFGQTRNNQEAFFDNLNMKTPSLALLNSIGFTNPAQKLLFAAAALKNALVSSPSVTISPAIPAVAAKPEVIAQTAKPARAVTPAVPGTANPTGTLFGELYLNSPAYPAGTAVPAIPAKPASAAVVGVPAVASVPMIPAVVSPVITAIKGWEDAIDISVDRTGKVLIIAELPYSSSMSLVGAIPNVTEITSPSLTIDKWLDAKASTTSESITDEPLTMEAYFYKYAKSYLALHPQVGRIEKSNKLVNGILIPTKRISLQIEATGYYDSASDSLQLAIINTL